MNGLMLMEIGMAYLGLGIKTVSCGVKSLMLMGNSMAYVGLGAKTAS